MTIRPILHVLAFALVLGASLRGTPALAQPLGTEFSYQGGLRDGGLPANGQYDLRFRLYDAAVGGVQVGPTLCADNILTVAGSLEVSLDFGPQFAGQRRWLELEVRHDSGLGCGDATGYTRLSPRQELTITPNAGFSLVAATATTAGSAATAANATHLGGQDAGFYRNAANLNAGTLPESRLAATVARTNIAQTFTGVQTLGNVANSISGVFTGNGAALTALSASNISAGTLADARLSTNVPLLNAAGNVFTGPLTAPGFNGPGAGITALNASNLASGTVSDARLSANVATLAGPQTFSGAKTFNAAPVFMAPTPFTVATTNVVPNLNSDLLDGQSGSFYQNAGSLSAGTVPDARLASNVARTTAVQNFSVQQTFSVQPVFSDPALPFLVNSAARVVNLNADLLDGQSGLFYQDAANLTGNLPDARLSANIPRLSTAQSFAGLQTLNGGLRLPAGAGAGRVLTSDATGNGSWQAPSIPNPLSLGGDVGGAVVSATNSSNTLFAGGVHGYSTATSGTTYGVWGRADSPGGRGVIGADGSATATGVGVWGESAYGTGVFAGATESTGVNYGLFAQSNSPDGYAGYFQGRGYVSGRLGLGEAHPDTALHLSSPDPEIRIWNSNDAQGGGFIRDTWGSLQMGIFNRSDSLWNRVRAHDARSFLAMDSSGKVGSCSNYGGAPAFRNLLDDGTGVMRPEALAMNFQGPYGAITQVAMGFGDSGGLTITRNGFWALNIEGYSDSGWGQAVMEVTNTRHWDGLPLSHQLYSTIFYGDIRVDRTAWCVGLAAGFKAFRIDHPLDPENKYLMHSCVESPDMMNIYNGNVTTGPDGLATVELPDYFEALNRDFRYQLTVMDESENDFIFAKIYRRVENSRFTIKTSTPGTQVSWQVTGIRKDALADYARIQPETEKPAAARGRYLHPQALGLPLERGESFTGKKAPGDEGN